MSLRLPLAIASINCTAILQSYFGLNSKVLVPVPEVIRSCKATSAIQRALLELSSKHPETTWQLQAIHAQLLLAMARQWARTHTSSTTILDFPACLQSTYRHFHLSVAATATPWSLHALIANLQQPASWITESSIDPNSPCLSATPMISFVFMLLSQLGCCGRTTTGDDAAFDNRVNYGRPTPFPRPLVAAI